jgi:hypothetical protein
MNFTVELSASKTVVDMKATHVVGFSNPHSPIAKGTGTIPLAGMFLVKTRP